MKMNIPVVSIAKCGAEFRKRLKSLEAEPSRSHIVLMACFSACPRAPSPRQLEVLGFATNPWGAPEAIPALPSRDAAFKIRAKIWRDWPQAEVWWCEVPRKLTHDKTSPIELYCSDGGVRIVYKRSSRMSWAIVPKYRQGSRLLYSAPKRSVSRQIGLCAAADAFWEQQDPDGTLRRSLKESRKQP